MSNIIFYKKVLTTSMGLIILVLTPILLSFYIKNYDNSGFGELVLIILFWLIAYLLVKYKTMQSNYDNIKRIIEKEHKEIIKKIEEKQTDGEMDDIVIMLENVMYDIDYKVDDEN